MTKYFDSITEAIHKEELHEDFNDWVGDVKRLQTLEQQAQWDAYIDQLQLNK